MLCTTKGENSRLPVEGFSNGSNKETMGEAGRREESSENWVVARDRKLELGVGGGGGVVERGELGPRLRRLRRRRRRRTGAFMAHTHTHLWHRT